MSLVLIVRISGHAVAIRADAVLSVVELDEIAPVPRAAPHVAGLAALRSRVLTVIDCYRAIGIDAPGTASREAVVVELDGHHYALTVDSVDDVVEASGEATAARTPLKGGWARIAAGTVEAEGNMLLLVDVAALIAGPQYAGPQALAA